MEEYRKAVQYGTRQEQALHLEEREQGAVRRRTLGLNAEALA